MNKMAAAFLVLTFFTPIYADDITNNFQANINQQSLDALAEDLGSLMGGGSFHSGEALGFPLGFDIGVHAPIVGIQDEDVILRDDGSSSNSVIGQLEIGLPARINIIGRYGEFQDGDVIGGGLRVGLLKSSVPGIPSISLTGLYTTLDHDYLDAETMSANLALSFAIPFIRPYIGVGFDTTKVEPTSEAYTGVPASVSRDLEGEGSGTRIEAGVNISVIPFTYLTLGAGITNGEKLYHLGLGVKI